MRIACAGRLGGPWTPEPQVVLHSVLFVWLDVAFFLGIKRKKNYDGAKDRKLLVRYFAKPRIWFSFGEIVLDKEKIMEKKLVVGIVVMLVTLPCYAALYSSDYEDYNVDQLLQPQSSTWWSSGAGAMVRVDPLDSENQCFEVTGSDSSVWLAGYGVNTVTDPMVYVDYDLYITQEAARTFTFAMTDNDSSDSVYVAVARSGADTVDYVTGGSWFTQSAPEVVTNQWMHIRYELDQIGNTFDMRINGSLVLNGANVWTDPISTDRLVFSIDTATVLIDNVAVTVPEPVTCMLMGLGGLGVVVRRNRK